MYYLLYTAALLSFINLCFFAHQIKTAKARPQSILSWILFSVIQTVMLASSIATGQPFWLILSYAVGTIVVTYVNYQEGNWQRWTFGDVTVVVGTVISLILWRCLTADYAVVAAVIALNIASIPLVKDLWKKPDPASFELFLIADFCALLTLIGTYPWTIGGSAFAVSGVIFNTVMSTINRPRRQEQNDQLWSVRNES